MDSAAEFKRTSSVSTINAFRESPSLLIFSANTQDSLRRLVNNSQEYLKRHPERITDLSYTLSKHRENLPHRAFSVVGGSSKANVSSFSKVPGKVSGLTMIFSGQGAQWPEMGKDLIQTDPTFREDIAAMDEILQSLKHSPPWRLESKRV